MAETAKIQGEIMNRTEQRQAQGLRMLNRGSQGVRIKLPSALYAILLLLLLSGCAAVGPDYAQPVPNSPQQWHAQMQGGVTAASPESTQLESWWTIFKEPLLESLITRGIKGNLDIKEAQARILEARALRGISQAGEFPTLDTAAAATKSRSSEKSSTGTERDLYAVGFDASWELDVFGGVRRSVEAAQATLEASHESLNALLVSLQAEIALNYIDLRTYQSRLAVSQKTLAALQHSYDLNLSRYQAGILDELALQESLRLLETSKALVPTLEIGLNAAKNRLAILLGENPGGLHDELATLQPLPRLPRELAVGIPAESLRRRPDVRRSERLLAAQSARIGVATADLYPQFRLSGSLGLEALSVDDLLQAGSRRWGFGPSVRWNVFDAGAIRRNIEVQNARQQQALVQYEKAVLSALEEVENALVAYAQEQGRKESLGKAMLAAEQVEKLARDKYQAGLVSFNNVLDAQRSLFVLRDELVRSDGATFSHLIRLYKALGGGWQSTFDGVTTTQ